jgi:hypothetical protein
MNCTSRLLAALALGLPVCAYAGPVTIAVDMPSLIGTYWMGGPTRSADFDLGAQFTSIDSAVLEVTGTGIPGTLLVCDSLNPMDCFTSALDPRLFYQFVSEPGMGNAPYGGLGVYGPPPPQTIFQVLDAPFTSLDFLLDGKGTLEMTHDGFACIAIYNCSVLTAAQVTVVPATARLVVSGNAVPEPPTFLLVMAVMALMARWRRVAAQVASDSGREQWSLHNAGAGLRVRARTDGR